jgi:predicted unusual protein kinase regulating ubiquinone biosynthesis (AarF/ABC1/UbiB family)
MSSSSTRLVIERARSIFAAHAELGTMFVKLGQVLSTRGDLLPEAYRTELAKLQDEVVPVPANVVTGVIREDLRDDELVDVWGERARR